MSGKIPTDSRARWRCQGAAITFFPLHPESRIWEEQYGPTWLATPRLRAPQMEPEPITDATRRRKVPPTPTVGGVGRQLTPDSRLTCRYGHRMSLARFLCRVRKLPENVSFFVFLCSHDCRLAMGSDAKPNGSRLTSFGLDARAPNTSRSGAPTGAKTSEAHVPPVEERNVTETLPGRRPGSHE